MSYKLLRALQKGFANFIILVLITLLVSSQPDTWAGLLKPLTGRLVSTLTEHRFKRHPSYLQRVIQGTDVTTDICTKTAVAPQHLASSMHALSFQLV